MQNFRDGMEITQDYELFVQDLVLRLVTIPGFNPVDEEIEKASQHAFSVAEKFFPRLEVEKARLADAASQDSIDALPEAPPKQMTKQERDDLQYLTEDIFRDLCRDNFSEHNAEPSELYEYAYSRARYFVEAFAETMREHGKTAPGVASARRNAMKRDGRQCKRCQETNRLAVHHIIPYSLAPSLAAKQWNMITLCKSCHDSVFGKEEQYMPELLRLICDGSN